MPNTLHLLAPKERGQPAQIVTTPAALRKLISALQEAAENHYATATFSQRDGVEFELHIEVIRHPHTHMAWRYTPMAYIGNRKLNQADPRNDSYFDRELLASQLRNARRAKGHDQRAAAAAVGVSVGLISNVESCKHVPKNGNLSRLCDYIGCKKEDFRIKEN